MVPVMVDANADEQPRRRSEEPDGEVSAQPSKCSGTGADKGKMS